MSCFLLRQSPSSDESTSSSHKWYHLPYTRLPGPRTAFLSSLGSPVQLSVLRRAVRSRYNVSVFLRAVRCSSPSSSRLPTPRTACPSVFLRAARSQVLLQIPVLCPPQGLQVPVQLFCPPWGCQVPGQLLRQGQILGLRALPGS